MEHKGKTGSALKCISLSAVVGQVTDEKISVTSCTAMALFIMSAAIMAGMSIKKKSIDFIMNSYPDIIKYFILPLMAIMVFGVYLMVIEKMRKDGAGLFKTIKKNPIFAIFTLAVILMIWSQIYNGMEYALNGYCSASLAETDPMEMIYFIFILFGATQVRKEAHKRFLLRMQMLVSSFLVVTAFLLWQELVESSFFYDWTPRFSSIFSNTNYYTYYLAVSVPLAGAYFMYEKCIVWKIIAAIAFMGNTVALSINNCTGGWIGATFAVIFIVVAHFIIEKKFNWQSIALIIVFAICMYVPGHILGTFEGNALEFGTDLANVITGAEGSEHAGSGRIQIWKDTMVIVNENPLLGIGFEGVGYWGFKGHPSNIRPHNEFIQYAVFHGYPMMICYFLGCLGIFIRALRRKKTMDGATLVSLSAAFGYLVSSFFGLTVFSTAAYLFIFLGMGYVREEQESKEEA